MREPFVDIHCHLLPGIDDGAKDWAESLAMAKMAAADGIGVIVATPHQLGTYAHNQGDDIRQRVRQVNDLLRQHDVPLTVLPGADVRIEAEMMHRLRDGSVLSLADRRKHVLLELPHEMYFPLEPVLANLQAAGMAGILSHPERNQGILREPDLIEPLIEHGCIMQITAGSLLGGMGGPPRELAESMVVRRQAHIVATDAHGMHSRRPLLTRAYRRVCELADEEFAKLLFRQNPQAVAKGGQVVIPQQVQAKKSWFEWMGLKKAA